MRTLREVHYDGSWEHLLTLFFEFYRERDILFRCEQDQHSLFDVVMPPSDPEKASRIQNYIMKYSGKTGLFRFQTVFCHQDPSAPDVLFRMLHELEKRGATAFDSIDGISLHFHDLYRAVSRERHRMIGLLRFQKLTDGTLYAPMTPAHDVLPLILSHFQHRLRQESWIIHDTRRETAFYHSPKQSFFMNTFQPPRCHDDEKTIASAWKAYYDHIAIPERRNPALRRQNMPKRYWHHLPEINQILPK